LPEVALPKRRAIFILAKGINERCGQVVEKRFIGRQIKQIFLTVGGVLSFSAWSVSRS